MTDETVSVHHRMHKSLHKRLKNLSVAVERPVTEIVNQSIHEWLERYDRVGDIHSDVATPILRSMLAGAKQNGDFYSQISTLPKRRLADVMDLLGLRGDMRLSRDSMAVAVFHLI